MKFDCGWTSMGCFKQLGFSLEQIIQLGTLVEFISYLHMVETHTKDHRGQWLGSEHVKKWP